jgi:hypothetical protein
VAGAEGPWVRIRHRAVFTNGAVFTAPFVLYYADLRAWTAGQHVALYDHSRYPQNPLTILDANPAGASSPWPPVPYVGVPVKHGLYVSFSATAFTGVLGVGFDR